MKSTSVLSTIEVFANLGNWYKTIVKTTESVGNHIIIE